MSFRDVVVKRSLAAVLAFGLLAAACTSQGQAASDGGGGGPTGSDAGDGGSAPSPVPTTVKRGALAKVACSLPKEQLLRVWRGTRLGRSGEILAVPIEPNFVDGGISHSGPWDYLQRVPMFWYGPGYIRARGKVARPVTVADIAPTQGELLGYPFPTPDGQPMREALIPAAERPNPAPPKLVVILVWDAAGRGVLARWPGTWPYLSSLIPKGTWYENATVGSSPSVTPPIHATIGTGTFPMHHGETDNQVRIGRRIMGAWQNGPAFMMRPTFADLYDLSTDNRAIVGQVSTLSWHLGMLGHGAMWEGGDEDIAVLRISTEDDGAEGVRWEIGKKLQPFFQSPGYVNDVPGFPEDIRAADQADGALDGKWRDRDIAELAGGFHTPARIPYQTRVIQEVVRREAFGRDEVPDLLYLNYKLIDEVGHLFTASAPQMEDALAIQDEYLKVLIDFLDRQVGEGEWVLGVTSDHGHTLSPDETGAFRISLRSMEADLAATFGEGTIERIRPSNIYVDVARLERNGFTLNQVAQFLNGYTKAQAARDGTTVPAGEPGDRVFAAVFPSSILGTLPCLPEARAGAAGGAPTAATEPDTS